MGHRQIGWRWKSLLGHQTLKCSKMYYIRATLISLETTTTVLLTFHLPSSFLIRKFLFIVSPSEQLAVVVDTSRTSITTCTVFPHRAVGSIQDVSFCVFCLRNNINRHKTLNFSFPSPLLSKYFRTCDSG